MMKDYDHIFIVTNDLINDRRMKRICGALAENDENVLLIGRIKPNSIELDKQSFDQVRLKCLFNKGFLFYLEFNFRAILFLIRCKIKTLTCIDLDTILIGGLLSIFLRFRFYFDAHEFFSEVPELKGHFYKRQVWNLIGKLAIPLTHKRYTVCDSLAEIFHSKYNLSFSVIKNVPEEISVNSNSLPPRVPFALCYLGVLNQGRGLEQMIDAMKKLPGCLMYIIGDGDIANKLKKICADNYELVNRIIFFGQLSEEEFAPILKRSHLGLNLLDSESKSYYYSLANKFFDYVNYGLPVLTMDFPEYKRLNHQHECCLLLKSLESTEIVKGIKALSLSNHYYTLRNNCFIAKKEWNWRNEKIKLLELYS